jgi:hypothetical protein
MKSIKGLLSSALALLALTAQAQTTDSIRTIGLSEVEVRGIRNRVQAVERSMYELSNPDNDYEQIAGFSSLVILDGAAGDELWSDSKKGCMQLILQNDSSYRVRWDKPGGGCSWVGMGVGWDAWSGKNLSALVDSAAIELKVRITAERPVKTLPLAFGLEDYSGRQAWMGMSARWVVDGPIGNQYAHIRLPLQEFNWPEQAADPGNVKQFIMQFEAAGEFDLRHIRIVRHAGSSRKQAIVVGEGELFATRWQQLGNDSVRLSWDNSRLYLEALLSDTEVLENSKQGSDLWNGDALELAIAAQPELSSRPRSRFLFSDLHIGIGLGAEVQAIEFRTQRPLQIERQLEARPEGGYRLKVAISWKELDREPWSLPGRYLLEIARDQGDASGRKAQYRWNSSDQEGFHTAPNLWGELVLTGTISKR